MVDGRAFIVLDETMAKWKCPRGYAPDVASCIARAALDDRAAGRVYNLAEPVSFTETEWVTRIAEVAGWTGQVMTAPMGRIPLPFHCEQSLDTDPSRFRRELGEIKLVDPTEALERTVAWERANPPAAFQGVGLLDYEAEDALLAELGRG
jgi:nucleoside-diphosphate-sugar epimerase